MRLKLDLTRATLESLFYLDGSGGTFFHGPVDHHTHGRVHVAEVIHADDGTSQIKMVEWDGMSPEPADTFSLDLSIPWVHERVAATCLRLLGVRDARAACMTVSSFGTVYTLRWVGERDGWPWPHTATAEDRKRDAWPLPYTASWDKLGGAPVVGAYQNDLVSAYRLKLSSIPRLELQPGATGDEALGALLLALDGREAGKAKGDR